MSQISSVGKWMILGAACLLAITGCGTPNSNAVFSNGHPAGWLPAGHKAAAQHDAVVCTECHGSDYSGGPADIACSSCHLGGPTSVHPANWQSAMPQQHSFYAKTYGTTACSNEYCHGTDLSGVSGSGPSCTSCHIGDTTHAHPASWGTGTGIAQYHGAYAAANGTTGCQNAACHGPSLTGVSGSGPSCTSCHIGDATDVHPLSWGTGSQVDQAHGAYVQANTTSACANAACHGTSLTGANGPSCTSCHIGGVISIHPTSWGTTTGTVALSHPSYVQTQLNGDTSTCANGACHGTDLTGANGPSCTSCHIGTPTSVHPVSWGTGTSIALNHAPYVAANSSTACQNNYCHGSSLSGVSGSGPACSSCHTNGSYPFTATGCTSCHGNPPNGTTYPNKTGAHDTTAGHFAAGVTLPDACSTCHSGAGTGTTNHFNGTVNVQILGAYNAETGTAAYNPASGTCSNVSCHGGQTTPVWATGSINVYQCDPNGTCSCLSCHKSASQGSPEYNDFYSGHHDLHVTQQGFVCVVCHNTTALAQNHFTSLNTTTLEGPASATIGRLVTSYTGTIGYTSGYCTTSCHTPREWFNPSTSQ